MSVSKKQRQIKERKREGSIDLSLPQILLSPLWLIWDVAPQVSNSKAELKQEFLIRLEKVETKKAGPGACGKDQSHG